MSKVRSDSWAGQLTLDEQAEIYEAWIAFKGKWEDFAGWISETYENAERPSRSALYAWAGDARDGEPGPGKSAYLQVRSARIRNAGQQMCEWAKSLPEGVQTEDLVSGFMTLACEAQSANRGKERSALIKDFCSLNDILLRRQELDLKAKAQATKDNQLKLAREKFEFDAAKKAMELAAEIKGIAADDGLDDDEKIQKVREALFG